MKNDVEIKNAFLKLVASKPIETINVSAICDELNLKRQTFYYHYHDIYELAESILSDYTDDLFSEEMNLYYLNKICDFTYENIYFFSSCINGGLKEAVTKFFFNLLLPYVESVVTSLENVKQLNNNDIGEIMAYHANAISLYLVDQFKNDDEDINIDHIVNKIEIFLDKENLERTAKLYFEKRREI